MSEIEVINENRVEEGNSNFYVSEKPLWNPKYFLWMSILFSYLPLSIFFILNFNRMKEFKKRNIGVIITVLSTILLYIVTCTIESESISKIVIMAIAYSMACYYRYSQIELYQKQVEKGVKSASFVLPAILSVVFVGAIIFALIRISILEEQMTLKTYERYDDVVYYWSDVNLEEVIPLADYLEEMGIFSEDDSVWEIGFCKEDEAYIMKMVFFEETIANPAFIEEVGDMRIDMENKLELPNKLLIHLCNSELEVLKVID